MRMEHEGINEIYEYEYNHLGNKKSFRHTKDGTVKNVSKYEYDEINRLKTKKLGSSELINSVASGSWNNTNIWQNSLLPTINDIIRINPGHEITINNGEAGSAGILYNAGTLNTYGQLKLGILLPSAGASDLQTVDYSYHIRGLRGINLDGNNNLTNKLFSMRLDYETAGFYDGNIGKQSWKSSLDGQKRSFTFSFDGASRILGALYTGTGSENYSLSNMSYDANGNLLSLSRKGKTGANSWGDIDQLSYIYQANSNKIQAVNDAILLSNPNVGDFRDSSSIATQYTYNQDGSLNYDDNKKISFEWNYLKKPKKITKANGQWQKFMYDASGVLLQTLTSTGKKIDYLGNLTFENDVLYQITHDEGRINASGQYEYDINDHAGNLRVTFRDSLGIAKIVTKLDYDVWGFRLKGLDYYANNATYNKFKTFSGKQLHDDFGFNLLSYKFRFHDPALGRFISIDPLAEEYSHNSTFAFAENKLGLGVEYEGLELAPFPASFMIAETVLPRPMMQPNLVRPMNPISRLVPELVGRTVETFSKPKIEPIVERVVRTSGGKHEWDSKLTPKENVKQHWDKGNAAHKEVQKGWKEEGFKTEHQLSKDSRTDGIKVDEATKVGTIRELKPNTPTGIKDGNAQLGRYIDRATTKYPNVNKWIPELHLYSTPPVVIPFKPN